MTATKMLQQMDELLSAYRLLFDLANRKRQIILDNNVNELARCFNEELLAMERISDIQATYRAAAAEFLTENGIQATDENLDGIAQWIKPEEARSKLLESQEQLMLLIDEIKRCNRQNRQLIDRSLEFINYMVELYQEPGGQEVTYDNPAAKRQSAAYGNQMNRFESRA